MLCLNNDILWGKEKKSGRRACCETTYNHPLPQPSHSKTIINRFPIFHLYSLFFFFFFKQPFQFQFKFPEMSFLAVIIL